MARIPGSRPDRTEVAEQIQVVARRLRRATAEAVEPLGVTLGQLRVLRILASADEPLRHGSLAQRLGVVPRSVTSVVDALVEAGAVTRTPDPTDRRASLVAPTAAGRRLLASGGHARRRSAEKVLGQLSDREVVALRRILTHLTA
jgi:DNA-binding MarR family transcriptional regulator